MIRVLIIIFISMSLKANLLERDDVKKFIDLAVEESNLTREEIIDYIKDAQPSPKAVELRSNQPEVKATWDDYRSKRVTDSRILNGVNFINENADIFNKVEKDYGVSKFYIASIIGLETNYGGIWVLLTLWIQFLLARLILIVNFGKESWLNYWFYQKDMG